MFPIEAQRRIITPELLLFDKNEITGLAQGPE